MIILKEHFNNNDTIIHDNWLMNGCQFFNISDDNVPTILLEHRVPDDVWQQVLDAVKSGKGNTETSSDLPVFAYHYCREVGDDCDMRKIIIDANDSICAYLYCNYISNDDDMRQVIIDTNDPIHAYLYYEYVSEDDDMLEIVRRTYDV